MSTPFWVSETARTCTAWLKRDVLKSVFTSPAAWCFATIWGAGAIYLAAIGRGDIVVSCLCLLAILMFLCVIPVGITKAEQRPNVRLSRTGRNLLLLQIAVIGFFVCMTLYTSLMFHGVVERHPIPVWSPIIGAFDRLGERVCKNRICTPYQLQLIQRLIIPQSLCFALERVVLCRYIPDM